MRWRLLAITAPLALAVAGCAAERASSPSALLPADTPFKTVSSKEAGMTVSVPDSTQVTRRRGAGVFRATFADWYVSGFAYSRREQLPRNRGQLRAARARLVAEVRRRDRRFKLRSARITRSRGSPAVALVGDQVLDEVRLRTRSLHVYKGRGEYVLEMAAPVAEFPSLDATVFDRVERSLRVTGKLR